MKYIAIAFVTTLLLILALLVAKILIPVTITGTFWARTTYDIALIVCGVIMANIVRILESWWTKHE